MGVCIGFLQLNVNTCPSQLLEDPALLCSAPPAVMTAQEEMLYPLCTSQTSPYTMLYSHLSLIWPNSSRPSISYLLWCHLSLYNTVSAFLVWNMRNTWLHPGDLWDKRYLLSVLMRTSRG